jgi:hypothetical protein
MKAAAVRRKGVHAAILSAVLILAFVGVAQASAGSFTWGGQFRHLLNSSSYGSSFAGTHTEYTYVYGGEHNWYYSSFYQEHWYGDSRVNERYLTQGTTNGQAYYTSSGTYHWTVGHDIESTYTHVNATVYHP